MVFLSVEPASRALKKKHEKSSHLVCSSVRKQILFQKKVLYFWNEVPALRTISSFERINEVFKMLQILKLGGSVITEKSEHTTARLDSIKRLAGEIASARNRKKFRLVLVNGAGSFGHAPVREYGLEEGIKNEKTRLGFTMVHKHVEDLNRILWDCLNEKGLVALPVHPASFVTQEDRKISRFDTAIIKGLLELDIIPLLYGDMVLDTRRGCSVISGDDIVPYLAVRLGAPRILMGSDTDGIYDRDPKKFPGARLIQEINSENYKKVMEGLSGSSKTDVTGGMKEKVRKLVESLRGTECVIYNAETEGLTEKALLGEKTGTVLVIS